LVLSFLFLKEKKEQNIPFLFPKEKKEQNIPFLFPKEEKEQSATPGRAGRQADAVRAQRADHRRLRAARCAWNQPE